MRRCEKKDNLDRRNQKNKLESSSVYKPIIFGFTIIVCIVVVIIVCNVGRVIQNNVPKEFLNFSDRVVGSDETSWCLILTNKSNPIPKDYKVKLKELSSGELIDTRIYPALQKMFDNARKDGVYPIVASGYRTPEKQESLMKEKINDYVKEGYSAKEAKTKAETWVAVPGTSEHQLGIAIDINADGIRSKGHEVYNWLGKNAHRYGFINRYPPDKKEITGVINEPWHYRYVGIAAAKEIKDQGICLEEYLHKIN
ncbi:MAG: M15 family metallopeptidase [Anaerovoracaceae bacterium]